MIYQFQYSYLCIQILLQYFQNILGNNTQLLKQLYWRDFYLQALIFLPNGNEYKHMDMRYNKIKWSNSKSDWIKLLNSQTGFLIVDAAINVTDGIDAPIPADADIGKEYAACPNGTACTGADVFKY